MQLKNRQRRVGPMRWDDSMERIEQIEAYKRALCRPLSAAEQIRYALDRAMIDVAIHCANKRREAAKKK